MSKSWKEIKKGGWVFDAKAFREEEKKRKEARTAQQIASSHLLETALTGHNNIQYWSSFDNHIEKLEEEIDNCYATINSTLEEIEEYKKEIEEIKKEKESFTTADYEPSVKPKWRENYDNPTEEELNWEKSAADAIKEHELEFHKDWVGAFYEPEKGPHGKMNTPQPTYEYVSSSSRIGYIKYARCLLCMRNGKNSLIDLTKQPGASS